MRRDAQGYLYFERRLDRMINSGYHIYPTKSKRSWRQRRRRRGQRVGEAHPRWGQSVIAYIVPNGEVAQQTLPDLLKERGWQGSPSTKCRANFEIVAQIP